MPKLLEIDNRPGYYIFDCPGCGCSHWLNTNPKYGAAWQLSGGVDKPTVSPSILVNPVDHRNRCHFFIKNGQMQYLNDCHHNLKNRTVDMVEM